MIEITNVEISGWQAAIRGMRNSHNSWDKSDSEFGIRDHIIGRKDQELMKKLARAGSCHAKYRRMIVVWCDIKAPLYWWKEADTYKVGTVVNSCSTMHTITDKPFELKDFSYGYITDDSEFFPMIDYLNMLRDKFLETGDRNIWYQIIQILPSAYNQKRTVMMNYEVLSNIFKYRSNHKLDEWLAFCHWIITSLPMSYLITINGEECNEHD